MVSWMASRAYPLQWQRLDSLFKAVLAIVIFLTPFFPSVNHGSVEISGPYMPNGYLICGRGPDHKFVLRKSTYDTDRWYTHSQTHKWDPGIFLDQSTGTVWAPPNFRPPFPLTEIFHSSLRFSLLPSSGMNTLLIARHNFSRSRLSTLLPLTIAPVPTIIVANLPAKEMSRNLSVNDALERMQPQAFATAVIALNGLPLGTHDVLRGVLEHINTQTSLDMDVLMIERFLSDPSFATATAEFTSSMILWKGSASFGTAFGRRLSPLEPLLIGAYIVFYPTADQAGKLAEYRRHHPSTTPTRTKPPPPGPPQKGARPSRDAGTGTRVPSASQVIVNAKTDFKNSDGKQRGRAIAHAAAQRTAGFHSLFNLPDDRELPSPAEITATESYRIQIIPANPNIGSAHSTFTLGFIHGGFEFDIYRDSSGDIIRDVMSTLRTHFEIQDFSKLHPDPGQDNVWAHKFMNNVFPKFIQRRSGTKPSTYFDVQVICAPEELPYYRAGMIQTFQALPHGLLMCGKYPTRLHLVSARGFTPQGVAVPPASLPDSVLKVVLLKSKCRIKIRLVEEHHMRNLVRYFYEMCPFSPHITAIGYLDSVRGIRPDHAAISSLDQQKVFIDFSTPDHALGAQRWLAAHRMPTEFNSTSKTIQYASLAAPMALKQFDFPMFDFCAVDQGHGQQTIVAHSDLFSRSRLEHIHHVCCGWIVAAYLISPPDGSVYSASMFVHGLSNLAHQLQKRIRDSDAIRAPMEGHVDIVDIIAERDHRLHRICTQLLDICRISSTSSDNDGFPTYRHLTLAALAPDYFHLSLTDLISLVGRKLAYVWSQQPFPAGKDASAAAQSHPPEADQTNFRMEDGTIQDEPKTANVFQPHYVHTAGPVFSLGELFLNLSSPRAMVGVSDTHYFLVLPADVRRAMRTHPMFTSVWASCDGPPIKLTSAASVSDEKRGGKSKTKSAERSTTQSHSNAFISLQLNDVENTELIDSQLSRVSHVSHIMPELIFTSDPLVELSISADVIITQEDHARIEGDGNCGINLVTHIRLDDIIGPGFESPGIYTEDGRAAILDTCSHLRHLLNHKFANTDALSIQQRIGVSEAIINCQSELQRIASMSAKEVKKTSAKPLKSLQLSDDVVLSILYMLEIPYIYGFEYKEGVSRARLLTSHSGKIKEPRIDLFQVTYQEMMDICDKIDSTWVIVNWSEHFFYVSLDKRNIRTLLQKQFEAITDLLRRRFEILHPERCHDDQAIGRPVAIHLHIPDVQLVEDLQLRKASVQTPRQRAGTRRSFARELIPCEFGHHLGLKNRRVPVVCVGSAPILKDLARLAAAEIVSKIPEREAICIRRDTGRRAINITEYQGTAAKTTAFPRFTEFTDRVIAILHEAKLVPANSMPYWALIRTVGTIRRQNPHSDVPRFHGITEGDLETHSLPYNVLIPTDTDSHPDVPYIIDFAYDVTDLLRAASHRSDFPISETVRIHGTPGNIICFQDAIHFGIEDCTAPRFHVEFHPPNYPSRNYDHARTESKETYDLSLYRGNPTHHYYFGDHVENAAVAPHPTMTEDDTTTEGMNDALLANAATDMMDRETDTPPNRSPITQTATPNDSVDMADEHDVLALHPPTQGEVTTIERMPDAPSANIAIDRMDRVTETPPDRSPIAQTEISANLEDTAYDMELRLFSELQIVDAPACLNPPRKRDHNGTEHTALAIQEALPDVPVLPLIHRCCSDSDSDTESVTSDDADADNFEDLQPATISRHNVEDICDILRQHTRTRQAFAPTVLLPRPFIVPDELDVGTIKQIKYIRDMKEKKPKGWRKMIAEPIRRVRDHTLARRTYANRTAMEKAWYANHKRDPQVVVHYSAYSAHIPNATAKSFIITLQTEWATIPKGELIVPLTPGCRTDPKSQSYMLIDQFAVPLYRSKIDWGLKEKEKDPTKRFCNFKQDKLKYFDHARYAMATGFSSDVNAQVAVMNATDGESYWLVATRDIPDHQCIIYLDPVMQADGQRGPIHRTYRSAKTLKELGIKISSLTRSEASAPRLPEPQVSLINWLGARWDNIGCMIRSKTMRTERSELHTIAYDQLLLFHIITNISCFIRTYKSNEEVLLSSKLSKYLDSTCPKWSRRWTANPQNEEELTLRYEESHHSGTDHKDQGTTHARVHGAEHAKQRPPAEPPPYRPPPEPPPLIHRMFHNMIALRWRRHCSKGESSNYAGDGPSKPTVATSHGRNTIKRFFVPLSSTDVLPIPQFRHSAKSYGPSNDIQFHTDASNSPLRDALLRTDPAAFQTRTRLRNAIIHCRRFRITLPRYRTICYYHTPPDGYCGLWTIFQLYVQTLPAHERPATDTLSWDSPWVQIQMARILTLALNQLDSLLTVMTEYGHIQETKTRLGIIIQSRAKYLQRHIRLSDWNRWFPGHHLSDSSCVTITQRHSDPTVPEYYLTGLELHVLSQTIYPNTCIWSCAPECRLVLHFRNAPTCTDLSRIYPGQSASLGEILTLLEDPRTAHISNEGQHFFLLQAVQPMWTESIERCFALIEHDVFQPRYQELPPLRPSPNRFAAISAEASMTYTMPDINDGEHTPEIIGVITNREVNTTPLSLRNATIRSPPSDKVSDDDVTSQRRSKRRSAFAKPQCDISLQTITSAFRICHGDINSLYESADPDHRQIASIIDSQQEYSPFRELKQEYEPSCIQRDQRTKPSPISDTYRQIYDKHRKRGGHIAVFPGTSNLEGAGRGLFLAPTKNIKKGTKLAYYGTTLDSDSFTQIIQSTEISVGDYVISGHHPNTGLLIGSDGMLEINEGGLGALACDPITDDHLDHYTIEIKPTADPKTGQVRWWVYAAQDIPHNTEIIELYLDYGQDYWLARLHLLPLQVQARIFLKYSDVQWSTIPHDIADTATTTWLRLSAMQNAVLQGHLAPISFQRLHLPTFKPSEMQFLTRHTHDSDEQAHLQNELSQKRQKLETPDRDIAPTLPINADHPLPIAPALSLHVQSMRTNQDAPWGDPPTKRVKNTACPLPNPISTTPQFLSQINNAPCNAPIERPAAAHSRSFPLGRTIPWTRHDKSEDYQQNPLSTNRRPRKSHCKTEQDLTLTYAIDPVIIDYYTYHCVRHEYLDLVCNNVLQQTADFSHRFSPKDYRLQFRTGLYIPKGTMILVPIGEIVTQKSARSQYQYEWERPDGVTLVMDTSQTEYDDELTSDTHPNLCRYIRYANQQKGALHAHNCKLSTTQYSNFPVYITTEHIDTRGGTPLDMVVQRLQSSRPTKTVSYEPSFKVFTGRKYTTPQRTADGTRSVSPLSQIDLMESKLSPHVEDIEDFVHPDIYCELERPTDRYCFRTTTSNSEIKFGSQNINGEYDNHSLYHAIHTLMHTEKITCMALIDARVPAEQSNRIRCLIRSHFKDSLTWIHIEPAAPPLARPDNKSRQSLVGGQIIIILGSDSIHCKSYTPDPMKLGIYLHMNICVSDPQRLVPPRYIHWVSCYIPHHNSWHKVEPTSGGLHAKLANYLLLAKRIPNVKGNTAIDWVFSKLSTILCRAHASQYTRTVVTGDFNEESTPQLGPKCVFTTRYQAMGLHQTWSELLTKNGISTLTYVKGLTDWSSIDHCLTNSHPSEVTSGGIGHHSTWLTICGIDHRPIWIGLTIQPMKQTQIQATLLKAYTAHLHADDPVFHAKYKAAIREIIAQNIQDNPSDNNPFIFSQLDRENPSRMGSKLECISRALPLLCAKIEEKYKQQKQHGGGYRKGLRYEHHESPITALMNIHLSLLANINQLTMRQGRTYEEVTRCIRRSTFKALRSSAVISKKVKWETEYKSIGIHPMTVWLDYSYMDPTYQDMLSSDIKILRKYLHCRQRKLRTARIKQHIAAREQKADCNKMKTVIQSFLNTKTDPWAWDSLTTATDPDDENTKFILTNSQEIHAELNTQAASLFAHPTDAFPEYMDQLADHEYSGWDEFLDNEADTEKLIDLMLHSQPLASPELIRHFAKTLCTHPNRLAMQGRFDTIFAQPLTTRYLRRLLNRMKNTAPGITGTSYGMLKILPEETIENVLEMLIEIWNAKHIPAFWKFKWLNLIPKDSAATINDITNLRPLGLLEVTRKLLTAAVCNRLKYGLFKWNMLHSSQNGFISNRSTSSEIMHLTHIISESNEFDFAIDLMTWDVAKAFDSVSRKVQYLCWRRVGVPSNIARFLVELDVESTFILKSPFALDLVAKHQHDPTSTELYRSIIEHGFSPQRGYTQGDVQSGLGWITCYDVLITALSTYSPDQHIRVRTLGSTIMTVDPDAYADDLVTTTRPEYTQTTADIVSIGTWALGLKIAHKKIRALSNHEKQGRCINVYDWKWKKIPIELKPPTDTVRILGVDFNLKLDWTQCYTELVKKLTALINLVCSKRGSIQTKLKIYRMCIHLKILYPAIHANFTESQLKHLDRITMKMFRYLGRLPENIAIHILNTTLGGIRVTRVSADINKRKWNILKRLAAEPVGTPGWTAAQGHTRQMMSTFDHVSMLSCNDCNSQQTKMPLSSRVDLFWTGSLIRYMQNSDLVINFRGCSKQQTTPLAKLHIEGNSDANSILDYADVTTVEELVTVNQSQQYEPAAWIQRVALHHSRICKYDNTRLDYQSLEDAITRYIASNEPISSQITISAGQTIVIKSKDTYKYFNVNGINVKDNALEGSSWTTSDPTTDPRSLKPFTPLTRDPSDIQLGVSWSHTITLDQNIEIIGRMICVDDVTPQGKALYYGIEFLPLKIDLSINQFRRPRFIPPWATGIAQDLLTLGHLPVVIASDASYVDTQADPITTVYGMQTSKHRACGAIVAATSKNIDGEERFSVGIQIDLSSIGTISSYSAELITGVATQQLLNAVGEIETVHYMDCQGAISKISSGLQPKAVTKCYNDILFCAWRLPQRMRIRYTPGHPKLKDQKIELRHALMQATDALSRREKNDKSEYEGRMPNGIYQISARDVLLGMYQIGDLYITSTKGDPIVGSIFCDKSRNEIQFKKYCADRKLKYNSMTDWTARGGRLLQPMFNYLKKTTSARKLYSFTKQVYDQFPNNYKLNQRDPLISSECTCCHLHATETAEHILYCPSKPRTMLRNHVLADMHQWIKNVENGTMNTVTQTFLFRMIDLLLNPQQKQVRGIWTGCPDISQLQNEDLLHGVPLNKNTKLTSQWMIQFHTRLLQHATTLWHMRCTEVARAPELQRFISASTTVSDLLTFLYTQDQIIPPSQRYRKQTEVTRYFRRSTSSTPRLPLTGRKRPPQTPVNCEPRDTQSPMPTRRIMLDIIPEQENEKEECPISGQKRDRVSHENDKLQTTLLKYFTKTSS